MARVTLDPTFRVGPVDPRVFGTFVEHMGRCVYTGIYEPGHPTDDGSGFRGDVADLIREMGPTVARYPGGTALSDLRRSHGQSEPHAIRTWCLGNELDGPWQLGAKTAEDYGRLAAETARGMRMVDPAVELVACGSSHSQMPTFAAWEATVLEHCYELVDYISLHSYYDPLPQELSTFLASSRDLDRVINGIVATADHVGARLKSRKRIDLSVDEWNVWYQSRFAGQDVLRYDGPRELIEDVYDVADAVVVGSLLITLLRHADRVRIACQAQLVEVIAPIMTRAGGGAWPQTIFHPFAQVTAHAVGEVLLLEPDVGGYDDGLHGHVPWLEAVATHDADSGAVTLLCVNRSLYEPLELRADVRALGQRRFLEATTLSDPDVRATNTEETPGRVAPRELTDVRMEDGALRAMLPPGLLVGDPTHQHPLEPEDRHDLSNRCTHLRSTPCPCHAPRAPARSDCRSPARSAGRPSAAEASSSPVAPLRCSLVAAVARGWAASPRPPASSPVSTRDPR